jgi:hypothetical protein
MADAVAIVSVATSGLVGLSGLVLNYRGAENARRWQGREQRLAELRDILDSAAQSLGIALQEIAGAHAEIALASGGPRPASAVRRLNDGREALTTLWILWNRVRVREGAAADVAVALSLAREAAARLDTLVRQELEGREASDADYRSRWNAAHTAEIGFYEIAASSVGLAPSKRRRAPRRTPV